LFNIFKKAKFSKKSNERSWVSNSFNLIWKFHYASPFRKYFNNIALLSRVIIVFPSQGYISCVLQSSQCPLKQTIEAYEYHHRKFNVSYERRFERWNLHFIF